MAMQFASAFTCIQPTATGPNPSEPRWWYNAITGEYKAVCKRSVRHAVGASSASERLPVELAEVQELEQLSDMATCEALQNSSTAFKSLSTQRSSSTSDQSLQ